MDALEVRFEQFFATVLFGVREELRRVTHQNLRFEKYAEDFGEEVIQIGGDMNHANFEIEGEGTDRLVLRDLGPWNRFPTITNDAEWVVAQVAEKLFGRRLLYIDSEGEMDELVVRDGKFAGFQPGPSE